jgi:hypothetical protein
MARTRQPIKTHWTDFIWYSQFDEFTVCARAQAEKVRGLDANDGDLLGDRQAQPIASVKDVLAAEIVTGHDPGGPRKRREPGHDLQLFLLPGVRVAAEPGGFVDPAYGTAPRDHRDKLDQPPHRPGLAGEPAEGESDVPLPVSRNARSVGQFQWRLDRTASACWNSVSDDQLCDQIARSQRSSRKCRSILYIDEKYMRT